MVDAFLREPSLDRRAEVAFSLPGWLTLVQGTCAPTGSTRIEMVEE